MLYTFWRTILRILFKCLFFFKTEGKENIPSSGPVLICSNHISNFDPIAVALVVPRPVHFMAKAELFRNPFMNWFLKELHAFPVKRDGVSKEAIQFALKTLRAGKVMGIFPAGTRSAQNIAAKRGAASFALKTQAVIIPTAIIGKYRIFSRVKVIYGKPIVLDQEKYADAIDDATSLIMDSIQDMMK